MRLSLAIAGLLIAGATGAAAAEPEKKPKRSELVCVDQKQSGSRLGKQRICMTRTEWEIHRRNTQDDISERQIRQVNPQG